MSIIDAWSRPLRPLVIGHRGSSGSSPENTLAAFHKAIEDAADGIELDVRMTKDGELVVLHDQSVKRTTNGRGKICDLTIAEVQLLDAGSWFHRKFSAERIPTLRQVFELLPRDAHLNIEVKTDSVRRKQDIVERSLVSLLQEQQFIHRVVVSSFDHTFLKRLHKLAPAITLGALYLPVRDFRKKPSKLCKNIGASVFVCSRAQLSRRIAADVRRHGIALACYGVNARKDVERAMACGATVLITDYPKEVKKLIGS